MKEIRIQDFERKELYKATGTSSAYGINLSSEFSFLIKEAAKCLYYASDILYDINSLNELIESGEEGIEFYGFREMGVDHTAFINGRINDVASYGDIHKVYRRIIAIEVKHNTEWYDNGIEVITSEVVF